MNAPEYLALSRNVRGFFVYHFTDVGNMVYLILFHSLSIGCNFTKIFRTNYLQVIKICI